jgi:hypothetical protein
MIARRRLALPILVSALAALAAAVAAHGSSHAAAGVRLVQVAASSSPSS